MVPVGLQNRNTSICTRIFCKCYLRCRAKAQTVECSKTNFRTDSVSPSPCIGAYNKCYRHPWMCLCNSRLVWEWDHLHDRVSLFLCIQQYLSTKDCLILLIECTQGMFSGPDAEVPFDLCMKVSDNLTTYTMYRGFAVDIMFIIIMPVYGQNKGKCQYPSSLPSHSIYIHNFITGIWLRIGCGTFPCVWAFFLRSWVWQVIPKSFLFLRKFFFLVR